jgi:hypothetical protein
VRTERIAPEGRGADRRNRPAAWALLLAGWALSGALLDAVRQREARRSEADAAVLAILRGPVEAPLDLATASPRELRRLPGIGPRRALAIADLRWERGPGFALQDVNGIGPRIEAGILAALQPGLEALAARDAKGQTSFGE